jgi:hypothetical protein
MAYDLSKLKWEDLVNLTNKNAGVDVWGNDMPYANRSNDWNLQAEDQALQDKIKKGNSTDYSSLGLKGVNFNIGEHGRQGGEGLFSFDVGDPTKYGALVKNPDGTVGQEIRQVPYHGAWDDKIMPGLTLAFLAAAGGAAASGIGTGAGAASGAGQAGGGAGLLSGGGGTSIAAMTPEAAYAGGLASSNAAVAGMGGASGIGSAGGALSVAGAGQAAAGGGGGLLGGGGGNSISAMTPQEVYAGGQASANGAVSGMGTPASIGQAGGALSVAPKPTDYLGMAKSGLSGAKTLAGALGGVGQGQGGGGMANGTTQSQIDPRMAKYIYGDESNQGILDIAQKMYQANPSGMNAQMVQGMNSQWNTLNDPKLKAGYDQIQNQGLGLLNMPMAGNPFTRGQTSAQPAGIPAYQAESLPNAGLLGASPFSLMNAGRATINPDMLKAYMGGNFTNRG